MEPTQAELPELDERVSECWAFGMCRYCFLKHVLCINQSLRSSTAF